MFLEIVGFLVIAFAAIYTSISAIFFIIMKREFSGRIEWFDWIYFAIALGLCYLTYYIAPFQFIAK